MRLATRREFLHSAALAPAALRAQSARRPNVIILITDDQGFGDLSLHGNPHLKTPHLDSIGRAGVQFTQFQVTPVCSPTRASLLTGRYNYRTGVVDTYLGRSMMHGDEVTLAELLGRAGYRTGIFGKWHLGDNYPLRSIDQGFQESLVHNGGGIGQPADPFGNKYFDPTLQHNGRAEKYKGYCTDIFFDAALQFIERNRRGPFFTYIATNAPHTPLELDESWAERFRTAGLDETSAKVYGMVENIDRNAGRLLDHLRKMNLEQDTILIYLTDNGPQQRRYNAGMRGLKTTPYQGGIRVPFFLRWPRVVRPNRAVDRIAAHIDVAPTLLEACGADKPSDLKLDGRSLMPLLRGGSPERWFDRTLFTQWHRGDEPRLNENCAARTQRWKLVNGRELYDLQTDPAEQNDLAAAQPEIAARLKKAYEDWFRDVSATRGYAPPRIVLGSEHENPTTLTRQDWRGPRAGWAADSLGHWEVEVARPGEYDITLRYTATPAAGRVVLRLNEESSMEVGERHALARFARRKLTAGPARLEAFIDYGEKQIGVHYVDARRL